MRRANLRVPRRFGSSGCLLNQYASGRLCRPRPKDANPARGANSAPAQRSPRTRPAPRPEARASHSITVRVDTWPGCDAIMECRRRLRFDEPADGGRFTLPIGIAPGLALSRLSGGRPRLIGRRRSRYVYASGVMSTNGAAVLETQCEWRNQSGRFFAPACWPVQTSSRVSPGRHSFGSDDARLYGVVHEPGGSQWPHARVRTRRCR